MTLFDRLMGPDGLAAAAELARDGREVVAVSACLLGHRVRWDGRHKLAPAVGEVPALLMPICPELLGGLGCPRPSVALHGGDGDAVLDGRAQAIGTDGVDHTAAFLLGAARADALCAAAGARRAILKERSPSCGCVEAGGQPGPGVVTARLLRRGLTVVSDEDCGRRALPPVVDDQRGPSV